MWTRAGRRQSDEGEGNCRCRADRADCGGLRVYLGRGESTSCQSSDCQQLQRSSGMSTEQATEEVTRLRLERLLNLEPPGCGAEDLTQVNPVHLRNRVAFCVAGPRNHEGRRSGQDCDLRRDRIPQLMRRRERVLAEVAELPLAAGARLASLDRRAPAGPAATLQDWRASDPSSRYFTLQFAESYLTGPLFRKIVARIEQLAWPPT